MPKSISVTDETYSKLEEIRKEKEKLAGCEVKMASVIDSLAEEKLK